MVDARTGRTPRWVLAPLFVVAGIVIGRLWSSPFEHVWSGTEPSGSGERAVANHEAAAPARTESERPQPSDSNRSRRMPGFAEAVEKVSAAVVQVLARFPITADNGEDGSSPHRVSGGSRGVRNGTGFVVNREGLVVTARHIVAQASEITIWTNLQTPCHAELVGEDEVTDLAVLRLVDPPPALHVVELGNSEDLRAGDWIVTVGNPFGFARSVTVGVVSYVGRHLRHYDLHVTNDFLQFSAQVNPGSSGSPVLDQDGRVVGVTTQAMESAQGISFAIPSHTLKWVLDEMHKSRDGRVHRGFLGIEFQPRGEDDYNAKEDGALITAVAEGEPAHRAGLRRGDVVLLLDGQHVRDAGELHERITHRTPGAKISLTVMREGKVIEPIEVALRELGAPPPSDELTHG